MFLDLDHFKAVNDMLGHSSGDLVLKDAADRLVQSVRDTDTVARFGGDEFTIVLENLKDPQDASLIAQKILDNMAPPFEMEGNEFFLSTSIGITIYPIDGNNIDDLLRDADAAMYRAKDIGRNNYLYYKSEMNARAFERQSFNSSLHRAIERQEFLLHYQPQIDLRSGHIIGLEALIRWQHPEFGLVTPGQFIPVAEDTELIIPIGDWVLRTACAQIKSWRKKTFPKLSLSLNLSARQFRRNDFATQVYSVIQSSGIDPNTLELELTESMLMENVNATDATLHLLKEMGVGLSIDDFGTGYSSLSYLQRFPIDSIKIAQAFMRDIPEIPDVAAIVKAIIALGRNLRVKIIAEGVEKKEQLAFLKEQECDVIQGYLICKPLPADQMTDFIINWDSSAFFRESGEETHQAWLFPYMQTEKH
jgi:diguanylate cyclase (GGDEF)-like protein